MKDETQEENGKDNKISSLEEWILCSLLVLPGFIAILLPTPNPTPPSSVWICATGEAFAIVAAWRLLRNSQRFKLAGLAGLVFHGGLSAVLVIANARRLFELQ